MNNELTVQEAAIKLGISPKTIQTRISRGHMKSVKRGKRRYVVIGEPEEPSVNVRQAEHNAYGLSVQLPKDDSVTICVRNANVVGTLIITGNSIEAYRPKGKKSSGSIKWETLFKLLESGFIT